MSESINKFVWCSPHPNHYNTYNYENIATIPGIEFRVVYFKKVLSKYPWKTDFKSSLDITFLKEGLFKIDWKFLFKAIFNKEEKFIVAGYNNPTMFLMLTFFMLSNKTFYIASDTPNTVKRTSLKSFFRNLWIQLLYKKLNYYFVTGKPGIDALVQLGLKREKIINLPFPTNIEFFVPSKNYEIRDEIVFISSGRLDNNHKGYDVAIKAFAKVSSSRYKLRYRIAGEGPDRNKIEALISSLGLQNVDLLGWLEPSELINFYHSGHVFVHSSNRDPFPNAVLEAMACGLPVIGSNAAGSVLDRVEPGVNGFIHQSKDVDSLVDQLNKIIALDPNQIKALGSNARLTAVKWPVSYNVKTFQHYLVNN